MAAYWEYVFCLVSGQLKAGREDLPLPSPFDKMFKLLNKVIDFFHLKNHKRRLCRKKYNPEKIYSMYPDLKNKSNTQSCEQTFSFLSRFKKILNSMTKTHHLFMLHRICLRRNRYLEAAYKRGRQPIHTWHFEFIYDICLNDDYLYILDILNSSMTFV